MSKHKKVYPIAFALSMLTQLGLSILTPIGLCIYLSGYLKDKFSLGNWVVLAGVLIGVGSGVCSMFNFIKMALKKIEEKESPSDD